MSKSERLKLQSDIAAVLLMDPLDNCLALLARYPAVPRRTFNRYVLDRRMALSGPVVAANRPSPPNTGQARSMEVLTPIDLFLEAENSGALGVGMLRRVYFEAWNDSLAAKGLGLDPLGGVVNATWLDASIVARLRLLDVRFSQSFEFLDQQEAELRGLLDAAHASSSELGELCERWTIEFALARWTKCCPPVEASRLHDLLRDAELTRPVLMGGRGRRGSPAAFKRSVAFRARWVLLGAKLLEEFWGPDLVKDLTSHMADRLIDLDRAGHEGIVVEWGRAMHAWKESRQCRL